MFNNKMITGLTLLLVFLFNPASRSQTMDHKNHNHKSHYIPEVNNTIKALSEEEVSQLLNGDGMGMAKAAELNSYPGPKHVLELSSELGLTQEQKEKTESFIVSVITEAKKLGELIVEKEKELDLLFKNNNADEKTIQDKVLAISELRGRLRLAHLNAHLKQKEILTKEQINAYNRLRGYNNN